MKSLSKSIFSRLSAGTILGLVFGVFLAGYAVFAFQAPPSGPPGGNVPAPLNVGPDPQVKSGGLWVGSLGVDGSTTIGGGLTVGGQLICLVNGTNCPPGGVPSGFVGFFNLSSCPSGWSALAAAQGRYLVGLPAGGTLAGTDGTALSNLEDRPVGQHNHGVTDPRHTHALRGGGNVSSNSSTAPGQFVAPSYGGVLDPSTNVTGISVNNAGGTVGTNAPYLQLLVCQKS